MAGSLGSELIELIPLALVITLSPLSIIPAVLVLHTPHPKPAGLAYLVGEMGPELFLPDVGGEIVAAEPTAEIMASRASGSAAGSVSVDLDVHGLPMRAETPREVVAQLRRAARIGLFAPSRRQGWSAP